MICFKWLTGIVDYRDFLPRFSDFPSARAGPWYFAPNVCCWHVRRGFHHCCIYIYLYTLM